MKKRILCLIAIFISLLSNHLHAQNFAFWVTNGTVYSVNAVRDTVYIGGTFTRISPPTGGAVPFSTLNTGDTIAGFPKVCGYVNSIITDGHGGYFIGGYFTCAGGQLRNNIAHILPDFSVDLNFFPFVNSAINSMVLSGDTLYLAGQFTNINGQQRGRLAAINLTNNTVTDWDPVANNTVNALLFAGNRIFAAGKFTDVGGQPRNGIASIKAAGSGIVDNWDPGNAGSCSNTQGPLDVNAILLNNGILYAGGAFDTLGGCGMRNHIAALDTATGFSTSWNPAGTNPNSTNGVVNCLAMADHIIYAGGSFTTFGNVAAKGLIAIDTAGTIQNWICNIGNSSMVNCIAIKGDTLFAGGNFTSIGSVNRNYLAAVRRSSAVASPIWNPNPNNASVLSLCLNGNTLYAGGNFTGVRGYDRNSLARMNAITGIVDSVWNPNITYTSVPPIVKTITFKNNSVFIGGLFASVHGNARTNIAEISKSGAGLPTSWNPTVGGGTVNVLAFNATKDTLYAGGNFTSINSNVRSHIAAFRTNLLSLSAWNPIVHGNVFALALKGALVYVGGDFDSVAGQPRTQIAALIGNQSSNQLTTWNPGTYIQTSGSVTSIAVGNNNTVYIGGNFHTYYSYHFASLDATTGVLNLINPGITGGYVTSMMLVDDSLIYLTGNFTSLNFGLIGRNRAAVIRTGNGNVYTNWNPNISDGITGSNQYVYCLTESSGSIFFGGNYSCYTDFSFGHFPSSNLYSAISVCLHPITVTAGADRSICAGDSVQLNVCCGGADYMWSPSSGLDATDIPNPIATPASTTNYIVNMRTADGCSGADTVKVTVFVPPAVPSITAHGPTTFCAGDSVLITSSPEYSYLWFPNGQTTNFTYGTGGNYYYVKVTDSHSCSRISDTIFVYHYDQPAVPLISVDQNTHHLVTNAVAEHYQWYFGAGHPIPGDTLSDIAPLAPGVYQVCVWDSTLCRTCSNTFLLLGTEDALSTKSDLLNVFPNPFSQKSAVQLSLHESSTARIELYDVIGNRMRILDEGVQIKSAGTYSYPLEIQEHGIYFIKLSTKSTEKLIRVVKN